eukprot:7322285-Prymnesium_polylepis.1
MATRPQRSLPATSGSTGSTRAWSRSRGWWASSRARAARASALARGKRSRGWTRECNVPYLGRLATE